jgi:phosphate starvation-inducible PhoH-like protein
MSISGPADLVTRASDIARRMIDRARQRMELTAGRRPSAERGRRRARRRCGRRRTESRCPVVRRLIQAKTSGQAEYLAKIAEHDIVVGIGPAGTGKTVSRGRRRPSTR